MKLSEAFRRGAEIIAEPGKWRQDGRYGYDPPYYSPDAGRYCMVGAVGKASGQSGYAVYQALVDSNFPSLLPITVFNDAPGTTQEDAVMASLFIAEYLEGEGE